MGGQRERSGVRVTNYTSSGRREGSRGLQRPVNSGTQSQAKTVGGGFYQGAPQSTVQISTELINQLKEELLQTWETYLIPDYHRTVFLDCIYGLAPD